jgi:hypothetical protein
MIFRLVASQLPSWLKWNYTNNSDDLIQPRKEEVSYPAIIEYLQALTKIYFKAKRDEKTRLLNHAAKITGRHRKSLIRILNFNIKIINNKKINCGAKVKYPEELLLPHIKYLWISMERISAKRMKAAFDDWLPQYHDNGVDNRIKYLLQKMSPSTLGRFLRKLRKLEVPIQKGLCSTSPARYMKNKVPINTLDYKITKPGFTQSDTVAHCGDRLEGAFMNSITITDIFSAWTENSAIFTKKGLEVKRSLNNIEKRLPFNLLAINTDSGSEFLNTPVFNMYREKKVAFTRSRPYKKNDNCYVEQKNFTHVRELFGYQRFECAELKKLMNEIYRDYWNPLQNYFFPTFKLKEKIRIGAKIKKIYGKPKTPYQRLMESDSLNENQKNELSQQKKLLNPFELKKGLEKRLSIFFKLVNEYNERKERQK